MKNENNETTKRHKNNNEYNDNNTSECDWVLGLELGIGLASGENGGGKGREGGKWFLFEPNGIFLLSWPGALFFLFRFV